MSKKSILTKTGIIRVIENMRILFAGRTETANAMNELNDVLITKGEIKKVNTILFPDTDGAVYLTPENLGVLSENSNFPVASVSGEKLIIGYRGHQDLPIGSDTLEWDGDYSNKTIVYDGFDYVHISDVVLTEEDFTGKPTCYVKWSSTGAETTYTTYSVLATGEINGDFWKSIPEDNFVNGDGDVYPKKGIYFVYAVNANTTMYCTKLTIPGFTGF